MGAEAEVLRIAVWHHPITGNEKMQDDAFLDQLKQAGNFLRHGHIHEDRADVIGYLERRRQIHIAGAGSFGAQAHHRPESTPRLHNVIEIGAITVRSQYILAAFEREVRSGRMGSLARHKAK